MAKPICLRLFMHCVRAAAARTFCTAGTSSAIRIAMMAITTRSSISVNADLEECFMVKLPRSKKDVWLFMESIDVSYNPKKRWVKGEIHYFFIKLLSALDVDRRILQVSWLTNCLGERQKRFLHLLGERHLLLIKIVDFPAILRLRKERTNGSGLVPCSLSFIAPVMQVPFPGAQQAALESIHTHGADCIGAHPFALPFDQRPKAVPVDGTGQLCRLLL